MTIHKFFLINRIDELIMSTATTTFEISVHFNHAIYITLSRNFKKHNDSMLFFLPNTKKCNEKKTRCDDHLGLIEKNYCEIL